MRHLLAAAGAPSRAIVSRAETRCKHLSSVSRGRASGSGHSTAPQGAFGRSRSPGPSRPQWTEPDA